MAVNGIQCFTPTPDIDSLVDQLKASVHDAAKDAESFDSVERTVLASVLQIGHQALE